MIRARTLATASAVAALVLTGTPAAAAQAPPLRVLSITDLGPGEGLLINDRGQVLGSRGEFFWDGTRRRPVTAPPGWAWNWTRFVLNDRGEVLGTLTSPDFRRTRAAIWRGGRVRLLPLPPGALDSRAADLNEHGVAVGTVEYADGTTHATLWRPGGRPLDLGRDFRPAAVNGRGEVAGTVWPPEAAGASTVLWRRGRLHVLATFDAAAGYGGAVTDLNDRGQVLGFRSHSGPNGESEVFVWSTGAPPSYVGIFDPRGINRRGDVFGYEYSMFWAYRWRDGVLSRLDDYADTAAAIDDRGTVVGTGEGGAGAWDVDGTRLTLGGLGGWSGAADINGRRQVTGTAAGADGADHAVIWQLGH